MDVLEKGVRWLLFWSKRLGTGNWEPRLPFCTLLFDRAFRAFSHPKKSYLLDARDSLHSEAVGVPLICQQECAVLGWSSQQLLGPDGKDKWTWRDGGVLERLHAPRKSFTILQAAL
jgi:hypothetical protein